MQRGVDTDPEIKAQALALYEETFSTYKAADELAEMGIEVHHATIARWANEVDGLTSRMRHEQKQALADTWYAVAQRGAERMVAVIEELPIAQTVIPSAVATDKYLKLTEEAPTGNIPSVTVFVGVKVD